MWYNISGKNKVPMEALKKGFEKLGFTEVKTYLNSGNVIFSSDRDDIRSFRNLIETMLKKQFDFNIPVFVTSKEELEEIKDPEILLLDEITSDLDGKSENDIIELLVQLSQEKTIILISHRINAIVNIPNIYVMDQGQIICRGNHQKLVEICPIYSLFVNSKEKNV